MKDICSDERAGIMISRNKDSTENFFKYQIENSLKNLSKILQLNHIVKEIYEEALQSNQSKKSIDKATVKKMS